MDPNKDKFAERLRNIEKRRPVPTVEEVGPAEPGALNALRHAAKGKQSNPTAMLGAGVGVAFAFALGLVVWEVLNPPEPLVEDSVAQRLAAAETQTDAAPTVD